MNEILARLTADGLINTGVEGGFNNVCCSTAYDSLCLSVSSWEQERGQALLSMIDGAEKFMSRPYSDLSDDEIEELSTLLDSEQGHEAALIILSEDCYEYVEAVRCEGVTNPKCIVYCAMWCPTSTYIVCRTICHAYQEGIDVDDIDELADYFYNNYATLAGCEEYEEGYQNRSLAQLEYVKGLGV